MLQGRRQNSVVCTPSRIRDFTRNAPQVEMLEKRCREFSQSSYFNLLGRVFHDIAKTNCSVSYGISSYAHGDGAKNAKRVVHFGSYNYSGLNGNPRILEAAQKALAKYGTTTSGVRLLNGTSELHVELEARLAAFLNTEACISYSSGYAANLATLSTLCGEGDIVMSDVLNHQSIVDGLRLSRATVVPYAHRQYDSLERKLEKFDWEKRKFIVSDGVFSMDGDIADINRITDLAMRYNAFIILDDAHGTSAVGPNGRGTAALFNTCEVDVITGSFSKGLPGIGGFVAGSQQVIDLLRFGSNNYIFSASLPPPIVAGLIESINILEEIPEIQERLQFNSDYLRAGIRTLGLDCMDSESPIIPVVMPSVEITCEMTKRLFEAGVFVNPVAFPAVGKKRSRLRINVSADHTKSDLDLCLEGLGKFGRQLRIVNR